MKYTGKTNNVIQSDGVIRCIIQLAIDKFDPDDEFDLNELGRLMTPPNGFRRKESCYDIDEKGGLTKVLLIYEG